jgi:hypothetical protein
MISLIFVVNWIPWFWKYVQVAVPLGRGAAVWLLKELITVGERQYACSNNWNSTAQFIICAVKSVICYFIYYCISLVIGAHSCQLMYIGLMHTNLVLLYLAVMHHFAVSGTVWLQFTTLLRTWHTDTYSTYCNTEIFSLFSAGARPVLCVTVLVTTCTTNKIHGF